MTRVVRAVPDVRAAEIEDDGPVRDGGCVMKLLESTSDEVIVIDWAVVGAEHVGASVKVTVCEPVRATVTDPTRVAPVRFHSGRFGIVSVAVTRASDAMFGAETVHVTVPVDVTPMV